MHTIIETTPITFLLVAGAPNIMIDRTNAHAILLCIKIANVLQSMHPIESTMISVCRRYSSAGAPTGKILK